MLSELFDDLLYYAEKALEFVGKTILRLLVVGIAATGGLFVYAAVVADSVGARIGWACGAGIVLWVFIASAASSRSPRDGS